MHHGARFDAKVIEGAGHLLNRTELESKVCGKGSLYLLCFVRSRLRSAGLDRILSLISVHGVRIHTRTIQPSSSLNIRAAFTFLAHTTPTIVIIDYTCLSSLLCCSISLLPRASLSTHTLIYTLVDSNKLPWNICLQHAAAMIAHWPTRLK